MLSCTTFCSRLLRLLRTSLDDSQRALSENFPPYRLCETANGGRPRWLDSGLASAQASHLADSFDRECIDLTGKLHVLPRALRRYVISGDRSMGITIGSWVLVLASVVRRSLL